ncbi:MATE efflux family protein [Actinidia rufa]|uniref:MATE efflux family protein n=1 Tax=Actinidia rufa TaxID=165716 RepID=A0A7J0GKP5_9ERIC|nr:MATE efflux family protein [Actinidia rufa]
MEFVVTAKASSTWTLKKISTPPFLAGQAHEAISSSFSSAEVERDFGTQAGAGATVSSARWMGVKAALAPIMGFHNCGPMQLHAQLCEPHFFWAVGGSGACRCFYCYVGNSRPCLWHHGMLTKIL